MCYCDFGFMQNYFCGGTHTPHSNSILSLQKTLEIPRPPRKSCPIIETIRVIFCCSHSFSHFNYFMVRFAFIIYQTFNTSVDSAPIYDRKILSL